MIDTTLSRRSLVAAGAGVAGALTLGSLVSGTSTQVACAEEAASDAAAAPADGTYSGTAASFGWTGQMTCDVTFEGGAITAIEVTEEHDSETGEWFANAQELLIPRIIDAQSIAVDSIAGATITSTAIKQCVAAAIDAAGGDSSTWQTAPEKSTETKTLEGYDVIVVGLGGSGILTYCSAAYQGAKVFGLEAAGKVGGNSACTTGPMALNSEYLKELYTNGEDYINEDDVYDTWMAYVESDEKADVISEAVYRSGSSIDYYNENFGFEFTGRDGLLGSFVVPEWDKLWAAYTADDDNTSFNALGPNKTYQFTRALDTANSLSSGSEYMTELKANSLIFDEAGAVVGVNATYYDGTTYEILRQQRGARDRRLHRQRRHDERVPRRHHQHARCDPVPRRRHPDGPVRRRRPLRHGHPADDPHQPGCQRHPHRRAHSRPEGHPHGPRPHHRPHHGHHYRRALGPARRTRTATS